VSGTLLLLAAASLGLAPQGAQSGSTQGQPDPPAGPQAILEVRADRETVYHHETIRLVLRFGFEREFLAERLIQPFQRRLDVPAQLHAPWTAGMACARALDGLAVPTLGTSEGASFALDEAVARARRCEQEQRGSLVYEVFEIERSFVATCPGELVFPAPYLGYAHATRFRLDAFGERVAQDRRDETLTGSQLTLTVLPLPEAGRPDDFGGAVGRFTVRAEASPDELHVGESLKLLLHVEGEGDLEHFDAPRLEGLEGFRLLGWVEQIEAGRRSLTYDLVPVSERGDVVLQRPAARYPPAPVILAGRRVPYERFIPYLTQFASREDLEARHLEVYRFFRTRDRSEALEIARSLDASFLALYGPDRVRFDTSGVLEPVHEEPGARLYRIRYD